MFVVVIHSEVLMYLRNRWKYLGDGFVFSKHLKIHWAKSEQSQIPVMILASDNVYKKSTLF